MTSRGLLVGRFQPPHLGHLKIVNNILEEIDEIIIIIAAAQISHTLKNPFTAGERLQMMKIMLKNAEIKSDSYWMIPAQDIMDNMLWVHHIRRLVPKFDVYYGNNPFTTLLFQQAGFETKGTTVFDREKYEATSIRQKIMNNQEITDLVDKSVSALIHEWKIGERLTATAELDKSGKIVGQRGSELSKTT
ncbi:MAG: nicotinamide-nucleotide adenylyltransferase [Candidatus Kariarchaeaceae archaeon]|jgi:nicotinamide-nucleotide adenylyltransferase